MQNSTPDIPSTTEQASPPLEAYVAGGRDEEIAFIFNDILKRGRRFDEVEIAWSQERLLPMLYERTRQYHIPATFATGIPMLYSKAGRTAAMYIEWIASGFKSAVLARMMFDALPSFDEYNKAHPDASMGRLKAATIIRHAEMGSGRTRTLEALDHLLAATASDDIPLPAGGEAARADISLLRMAFSDLLDVTPVHDGSEDIDHPALATAVSFLLQNLYRVTSGSERDSYPVLMDWLDHRMADAPKRLPLREGLERFDADLRALRFAAHPPEAGAIHIAPLLGGQRSDRPLLYVPGLDTPPAGGAAESPPSFPAHADTSGSAAASLDDDVRTELFRIAEAASRHAVLTCASEDRAEGLARIPAPSLRQLLTSRDLRLFPIAVPADDQAWLDLSDWWLAQLDKRRAATGLRMRLAETWPLLGQPDGAASASPALQITLPATGDERDCEEIAMLRACPYRWFLRHELGVRSPARIPWPPATGIPAADPASSDTPAVTAGGPVRDTSSRDATALREKQHAVWIPAQHVESDAAAVRAAVQADAERGELPRCLSREDCHRQRCEYLSVCDRWPAVYGRHAGATGSSIQPRARHALSESLELGHLLSAMRAMTDPQDPLHVTAFLLGPYVQTSEASLLAHARNGGAFTLLDSNWNDMDWRIRDGLEVLKRSAREMRSNTPSVALARLFTMLGALPFARMQPDGARRVEALRTVLAIARKLSAEGETFAGIVAHIAALREGTGNVGPLTSGDTDDHTATTTPYDPHSTANRVTSPSRMPAETDRPGAPDFPKPPKANLFRNNPMTSALATSSEGPD